MGEIASAKDAGKEHSPRVVHESATVAGSTTTRSGAVPETSPTAGAGARAAWMRQLQRSVGNARAGAMAAVPDVLRGSGQPLTAPLKEEMEARLGADFSDVRIHTDAPADSAAQSVDGHAFTSGSHVVFQHGRYDAGSAAGQRLLAHELTHVLQQRAGTVAGTDRGYGLRVSDPADRFEREAEANAARTVTKVPIPGIQASVERLPGCGLDNFRQPGGCVAEAVRLAVQREITVGTDRYGDDVVPSNLSLSERRLHESSSYEFRKKLLNVLDARKYDATKKLWKVVEPAARGETTLKFSDWDTMFGSFVADGLLDKKLPSGGIPVGPLGLGRRPTWSTETAAAIKAARDKKGLAARHVLSSSTLGRAIEVSTADLDTLNEWLAQHGENHKPAIPGAKRSMWEVVNSHAGNLWMGPAGANTAIGFVRPVLLNLKSRLPETATQVIDVKGLQALIQQSYVTEGQDNDRNRTWNLLLSTLWAEVGEFGETAPRDVVVALIDMYYRNADIDPPSLTDDEYNYMVQVWHLLQDPERVLEGLTLFMGRNLTSAIAGGSSLPPARTAKRAAGGEGQPHRKKRKKRR